MSVANAIPSSLKALAVLRAKAPPAPPIQTCCASRPNTAWRLPPMVVGNPSHKMHFPSTNRAPVGQPQPQLPPSQLAMAPGGAAHWRSQLPQLPGSSNETQAVPHCSGVGAAQLATQLPVEQSGIAAPQLLLHEPQVAPLVKPASQPSSTRAEQWPRLGRQADSISHTPPAQRTLVGSTPGSARQSMAQASSWV